MTLIGQLDSRPGMWVPHAQYIFAVIDTEDEKFTIHLTETKYNYSGDYKASIKLVTEIKEDIP